MTEEDNMQKIREMIENLISLKLKIRTANYDNNVDFLIIYRNEKTGITLLSNISVPYDYLADDKIDWKIMDYKITSSLFDIENELAVYVGRRRMSVFISILQYWFDFFKAQVNPYSTQDPEKYAFEEIKKLINFAGYR
ncbi:MAG: hypothetical protein DRI44_02570 [Chlamydiae bacterium]|nr:MAG: hypothetical protein DRI44_02570 [Chlamydiota bacterium]